MGLSDYELKLYRELQNWEETFFVEETNDFERMYDYWLEQSIELIPDELRERFFNNLDQWLFYVQNAIQQSQNVNEKIELILTQAQIHNNQIQTVADLKLLPIEQLNHFANQQISNHQLLSLFQGGMSGSGHTLLLGADLPLMLTINLRAVQLIGSTYGYDMRYPFEMMIALKVFYCATLPKRFQKMFWQELMEEVTNASIPFLYEGNEKITDASWLTRPLSQILKGWFIYLFNKKKETSNSLFSIVFSAGINYAITKKVVSFAKRFYQYRLLQEKLDNH
ncbi:EcsC family protein [Caldibacillus thermoamylovorans]|uniref:EcsC family protein n=1 Tax=Caldibacillus thermoamylovorans TaxID=35841 RepID=UPI00203C86DB|nr:EcsC family protein [Caldibacillus thermoamylovorans]MCM3798153.1 EcsC family protein [Caldibacillus thermoamylovorans]